MASKNKHCDFCGKKCIKTEMINYKDKALLCDIGCQKLWVESYGTEEDKSEEGVECSK